MKVGDLVQIKVPVLGLPTGPGLVVGPNDKWLINPKIKVMFQGEIKEIHFTNLTVISETR